MIAERRADTGGLARIEIPVAARRRHDDADVRRADASIRERAADRSCEGRLLSGLAGRHRLLGLSRVRSFAGRGVAAAEPARTPDDLRATRPSVFLGLLRDERSALAHARPAPCSGTGADAGAAAVLGRQTARAIEPEERLVADFLRPADEQRIGAPALDQLRAVADRLQPRRRARGDRAVD